MRAARLSMLLSTALAVGGFLVACNQPLAPPTPPTATAPTVTGSSPLLHTVSGVVFDGTAQGPRTGAGNFVNYLVETGGTVGRVVVDADGRYTIPNVPHGSKIRATAFGGGDLKQTCAAHAFVDADTVLDIELVRPGTRSLRHRAPTLSGVVFQTTAEGRQPVAGTQVVYYSVFKGTYDVYMTTDANGRFEFCGLPLGAGDLMAGDCHDATLQVPVEIRGDATAVDVDLTSWIRECPR